MSEIKEIETAIETDAKAVETETKGVMTKVAAEITGVKSDVEKTAQELYGDAKKFENATVADVKKVFVAITNDEKLIVTGIENEFLKTQVDIQALQLKIGELVKSADATQKKFDSFITSLAKKYAIDPAKQVFDIVAKGFKSL